MILPASAAWPPATSRTFRTPTDLPEVTPSQILDAIDHVIAGRWAAAHAVAQAHEGEPLADWLHAILHKIEGDPGNARAWYRRAGRLAHASDEPAAELRLLREAVAASVVPSPHTTNRRPS